MHARFQVPGSDPDRDVQYDEVTGRSTLQGEILEMLTQLAKAAGVSKKKYLMDRIRELLGPGGKMERLIAKHRGNGRAIVAELNSVFINDAVRRFE